MKISYFKDGKLNPPYRSEKRYPIVVCSACKGTKQVPFYKKPLATANILLKVRNYFEDKIEYVPCPKCNATGRVEGEWNFRYNYYDADGNEVPDVEYDAYREKILAERQAHAEKLQKDKEDREQINLMKRAMKEFLAEQDDGK